MTSRTIRSRKGFGGEINTLIPWTECSFLVAHLPDAGDSLAGAMADLARDPTVTSCDEVIARMQTASYAVVWLRRHLVEGRQ